MSPNPICIGDTITFTLSGVVDDGGIKRVDCTAKTEVSPVTPDYTWEITKPDATTLAGSGETATVVASIPGEYSCTFTATADRDCPPPELSIGPATGTAAELKSQTFATVPADRSRTTIGVCEQVTITTNPATNATWTVIGGGSLSLTSGASTTFTAADSGGTSTVTATFTSGAGCEIQFGVIVPTGVSMIVVPGSKMHYNGTASAGFYATVTVVPTTVAFGNIQVQEQAVNPVVTGFYSTYIFPHAQGSWFDVGGNNVLNGQDMVWSGVKNPPFSPGTFLWAIPWHYRCAGSAGTGGLFSIVDQFWSATTTGAVTISKAGASITCQSGDPTTP